MFVSRRRSAETPDKPNDNGSVLDSAQDRLQCISNAMRLHRISLLTPVSLALLVIVAQHSAAGEVKKIAKFATIAYLVHKHLHPKATTAFHISEP